MSQFFINHSYFFSIKNVCTHRQTNILVPQAAQGAVRLEGDVITANGSILSGQIGNHGNVLSFDDEASVCSCRCSGFQRKRRRPRFTVRRSPGKISHLLPMQQLSALNVQDDELHSSELESLQFPPLYQHRASIWRCSAARSVVLLEQEQHHYHEQPRRESVWGERVFALQGRRLQRILIVVETLSSPPRVLFLSLYTFLFLSLPFFLSISFSLSLFPPPPLSVFRSRRTRVGSRIDS